MSETPANDARARRRFLVINVLRLGGVACVIAAMLVLGGKLALPAIVGWLLLGVGMIDAVFVPQLLARKWRTPPQ